MVPNVMPEPTRMLTKICTFLFTHGSAVSLYFSNKLNRKPGPMQSALLTVKLLGIIFSMRVIRNGPQSALILGSFVRGKTAVWISPWFENL